MAAVLLFCFAVSCSGGFEPETEIEAIVWEEWQSDAVAAQNTCDLERRANVSYGELLLDTPYGELDFLTDDGLEDNATNRGKLVIALERVMESEC